MEFHKSFIIFLLSLLTYALTSGKTTSTISSRSSSTSTTTTTTNQPSSTSTRNPTCYSNSDCDDDKICKDNKCQCDKGYSPDDSGFCVKQTCSSRLCLDSRKFCNFYNFCVCTDIYQEYNGDCFEKRCQSNLDCSNSIDDQVCDPINKVCKCGEHSRVNPNNGYCSEYYCDNTNQCQSDDENSFCSNNLCKCLTNYERDSIDSKCKLKDGKCDDDKSCGSDPNKECKNGICVCSDGYIQPSDSKADCVKKSSTHESKCWSQLYCSEQYQRCVDNQCICKPNYYFDVDTQKCKYFSCDTSSTKCWYLNDYFRSCSYITGSCDCNSGYYPDTSNGDKCVLRIPTYSPSTSESGTNYTWLYVILPIVIVIGLISGCISAMKKMSRPTVMTATQSRSTVPTVRINQTTTSTLDSSNRLSRSRPQLTVDTTNTILWTPSEDHIPRTPPPPYSECVRN